MSLAGPSQEARGPGFPLHGTLGSAYDRLRMERTMIEGRVEASDAIEADAAKREWVTPEFVALDLSTARLGAIIEPDSLPP